VIAGEIDTMAGGNVSADELDKAKKYLMGLLWLRFGHLDKIARETAASPARRARHGLFRAPQFRDRGRHGGRHFTCGQAAAGHQEDAGRSS